MIRDLFDKFLLLGLVAVAVAIALVLGGFFGQDDALITQKRNPAVERAMQEKARSAFLLETYQPVEHLMLSDRHAEALLKLQEFDKTFPGEPHTMILRGSILVTQGVLSEGLAQYAAAVKINGDYVDEKSSLHRRDEINQLVESAVPAIRKSLQVASTPTLEKSLRDAYYLQSRLAGGCE